MEEETPEMLMQSYHLLIGTTYFPPYWALGFQLCKYGNNDIPKILMMNHFMHIII